MRRMEEGGRGRGRHRISTHAQRLSSQTICLHRMRASLACIVCVHHEQEELLSSDSMERLVKLPCALLRACAGSLLGPIDSEMASLVAASQLAVGNLQQVPPLESARASWPVALPLCWLFRTRARFLSLPRSCIRLAVAGIDEPHTNTHTHTHTERKERAQGWGVGKQGAASAKQLRALPCTHGKDARASRASDHAPCALAQRACVRRRRRRRRLY